MDVGEVYLGVPCTTFGIFKEKCSVTHTEWLLK